MWSIFEVQHKFPSKKKCELIHVSDRLHITDMSLDNGAPKEDEFVDTHEDEGNDEV